VGATAQLTIRVTPRADADRLGPLAAGVLQARVTRPPADGEANEAVRALVARALGVPRSAVNLVAGRRSRTKRLVIDGLTPSELARRLAHIGD
jgi:uncharacterized protein YggU (UPF0235/DUF167 family)